MPQESSAWDSSHSTVKFILGLFLVVGLFSFVTFGIKQLLFVREIRHDAPPKKIDLTQTPDANFGKGYYQVQGFLGGPIEYVYQIGDTGPTKFYYYPLFSDVERKNPKLLMLDDRTPPSLEKIGPTLLTLRGVIGVENAPSEVQNKFESPLPVLELEATPPEFFKILRWFIPVSIFFLIGFFLVIEWILKMKKQAL